MEDDSLLLRDYDGFVNLFRQVFKRWGARQAKKAELLNIIQGNHEVSAYMAHFQRLADSTIWTEDTKVVVLYRGLKEKLKDAMVTVVPRPETVAGLVDLALQLEQHPSERKEERQKTDHRKPAVRVIREHPREEGHPQPTAPEPMMVDAICPPLTDKERNRCLREDACLYCGETGHYLRSCPRKPRRRPQEGNGPACRYRKRQC